MKILLLTSEYGENGGGLSYACSCYHSLLRDQLGYDVTVVSSVHNPIVTVKGGYNPTLSTRISHEYRLKTDTYRYMDKGYYFIIAFGGSFNGYYASLLARRLNTSFILMLRGTDINLSKWDAQEAFYLREACAASIQIICLSEEMIDNIQMLVPASRSKCMVIPNVMDKKPGAAFFPNYPNKLVIGCSATHTNEKKGIANLLFVLKAIQEQLTIPVSLVIQGSIDEDLLQEYKRLAASLQIVQNVDFMGYKMRQDCLRDQKQWDIYIQTSVCEGLGNSVLEAITEGTPVLLSPTGFISETLRPKFPQLVFDDFMPQTIAHKLISLLTNESKEQLYRDAYALLYSRMMESEVVRLWNHVLGINATFKQAPKIRPTLLTVVMHDVQGDIHDPITTPVTVFTEFIDLLTLQGYGLCSLRDYLAKNSEERTRWVVCTFDDAYASLIDHVLPILKRKGFTATVFVNTQLIGKDNSWNCKDSRKRNHLDRAGLLELTKQGWEIASHGHTHRNLCQLTESEIEYEFAESQAILNKLVGPVITYAYPYGESSPFIRHICKRYYNYAFALHSGGTELAVDNMQIRRYSLDEITQILDL